MQPCGWQRGELPGSGSRSGLLQRRTPLPGGRSEEQDKVILRLFDSL